MLGNRIKKLRKDNGLTQVEFGNKLGVVKQTVSSWENGISSPNNETLANIASIFKVSVDELLGIDKQESSDSNMMHCPDISNRIKKLSQKKKIDPIKSKLQTNILNGTTTNDERFMQDIYLLSDYFGISDTYLLTGEEDDDTPLDPNLSKGVPDGAFLLLDIYKELSPEYRRKLLSIALSLSEEHGSRSSSVAADELNSKTGTDNLGK